MSSKALRYLCISDATVQNECGDRMYPNYAPQTAATPYITYILLASNRFDSHDGPADLVEQVYDLDIWADDYVTARTIGDAVRKRLNGSKGDVSVSGNVYSLAKVEIDDESDGPQTPQDGAEVGEFNVSMRIRVWWYEDTG